MLAQMSKLYPYSLRPVLIITSILGLAWALVLGVASINDRGDDFGECLACLVSWSGMSWPDPSAETTNMKTFDLILGIMYFVVAAVEVFGLVVAVTVSVDAE